MSVDDGFSARVGTWLRGKWKLERLIAVGGMAGVFEARHKIGRVAAIKLLRPEVAFDRSVRERFEQEAAAVNSVGHHAIVQVLDVDEAEDGTPFLVMELLEGETLADRAEDDKRMKPELLLDIVDQLLDVLVACHKKGIIHRDIKPENLFLQSNGRLKVLDFGIARVREGVRTIAGTMLGTVAFMPPEQLKGEKVDARSDLFAVGATMFAVMAGRRLHLAKDDAELATMMLSRPAPALASVSSAPEPLCWVVDRALAHLPKRRYPDAQTMRGDVWAARRGERPPYASACLRAGQAADAMSEEDDAQERSTPTQSDKSPARLGGDLPTTDPQMPVFVSGMPVPVTEPQLPAFAAHQEPLPDATQEDAEPRGASASGASASGASATKDHSDPEPKTGANAAKTKLGIGHSDADDDMAPHTDEHWRPGDAGGADDDEDGVGSAGDDGAASAEASTQDDPAPEGDQAPEGSLATDKEAAEDEEAASDDEARAVPSDAPDDSPSSEVFDSLPPQGAAPEIDATQVAQAQTKSYGIWILVLLVLGTVAYGVWYVQVLQVPSPAPKGSGTAKP